MIPNRRLRSYLAATCVAFPSLGCSSSQLPSSSQHPASQDAPQAPLPPVGRALSEPAEPESMAAHSPDGHAHEGGTSTVTQANEGDQEAKSWTCPMHPEVVQSEPGKCPKCGMKLVPVTPKH
jgi:hypothetical protein